MPPPRHHPELEQLYFCKSGGIPWLKVGDITKSKRKFVFYTSEKLTLEGAKRCRAKLVGKGQVVVVGSGVNSKQLGAVQISDCELALNTTLWGLKSQLLEGTLLPSSYIYFVVKENIYKLKRLINSSTERVSFDLRRFLVFPIKLPPLLLIQRFNQVCEPLFKLQRNNEEIIDNCLKLQKVWVESLD